MASPQDIRIAIKGAGKLARFDRSGLALLGNTPDDAWRSFHAAILVGPFFLIWLALNGFEVAHGSLFHGVITEMLAYAVGWLLFPVIMWQVSDALNCRQNYSRFIVAYNWSALLQHGLFIGSDLMMIGLGFPDSAKGLVLVIVLGYMLVYQWFVAKNALEVTSGIAVLIVAIDLLTSVLWETVSTGLASG